MPHCARNVLARKFRQNWMNKFSDIRYSSFMDKEIDDSLTNLNWLPNMNLNKLTSQTMPISPVTVSSMNSGQLMMDMRQTYGPETNMANDIVCNWDQIDDSTRIFYKTHTTGRPPFSHISLICMAIQDIGQSRITSTQICEWIIINFPYYQLLDSSWQNSVRNLLSVSKCFQKVPRRKDEPEKGGFWRLSGDYQKYINQTSNTSCQTSNTTSGKPIYSQSSLYNDCYGSSNQYLSSFSQISNTDSGHSSNLSSCSRKSYSKSSSCSTHSNYNSVNRNSQQNQYFNQLKRQKSKYHNSIVPFNIHSSYSQFQQHMNSNFLQECNNDNRYCSKNYFYMNPAAISTPIGKTSNTYPSHFSHYPYFSVNGKSRNRQIVENERFYNNSRQGIHRFGSNNRQSSSLFSKSFTDSNYNSRLSSSSSSLQQSSNSAFSSFRNLVHKRSYQFSVQSPDCRQFSQFNKNYSLGDNLDYRNYKNTCIKPGDDLNKSLKYIDQSDLPLSFSSSDQFLINPDLVKNEISFNSSPIFESAELSDPNLVQIKEESKSTSNGWWSQSHFDSCALDTLPSCEKLEHLPTCQMYRLISILNYHLFINRENKKHLIDRIKFKMIVQ